MYRQIFDFIRRGMGLILLLPFLACAAPTHKLNLFIWSEYIDPQVVADFEQRFDCKVTIDLYEDEASMMAKLQGGGAALYDVVVPPDHSVPVLAKLKLIRPLHHAAIPNKKNIDPKFASPPYDPGNKYSIPFQWGTVGLLVRPAAGQTVSATWSLMFDPKRQPGAMVMLDSDRDMIGAALKYLGHSLNATNINQLKAARDLLIQTKKRSSGFVGAVGGRNKVLAREAAIAIVYSGDAVRAMKEDPATVYLIPEEGSQIWVDNLAVPAQAPHGEMAEKFLNYILEPAVGARLAAFNQYATPNRAAKPFVPAADLNNPAIYPTPEKLAKLEFLRSLGKHSRLYDEVWTQVKSK